MTWLIVIGGLVLVVFVHELGHFSVALAVGMRPRSFYIGFPPALVKVRRNGIEYGIGMIPLGGLVRIPGMHRPAASDLRTFIEPAVREQPDLAPAVGAVRRALDAEDYDAARRAYPELEQDVGAARLSPAARRSAERALRDLEEGTARDAYWRASTWKRVAVIAAGPFANIFLAFAILFTVYTPVYSTITAVCVIFLYISYVLPTVAGLIAHGRTWTRMGPWHIGRWYRPLAVIAAVGCLFLIVIGMQPPNQQAFWIVGAVVLLLALTWFTFERRRFQGPPKAELID